VAVGRRFVHATGTQGGQKDRVQVLQSLDFLASTSVYMTCV